STKPRSQGAGGRIALPKRPCRVTEFVVPLGPPGRKAPDLVATRSAIPWFRNQFHRAEHRVLTARLQETALVVEAVRFAGEDRSKIKAKAVHFGFLHPVAKTIGHHLHDA